ncbi:MAG: prohibitin family protein [Gammaproteobacteria bacterium]|nr:prohibitin family protein [Gammaproteobacteria bacterium]
MNTQQSQSAKSGTARKKGFKFWLKDKAPYFVVIFLVILIIVIFFFWRIFIIVKAGEAGVLYRLLTTGTETSYIYPERFHLILPWDTMQIYNMRVQTIHHDLSVLTKQGLTITLNLAIRFQPEYDMVGLLHKDVGPDYVNIIIIPQIESVLRRNIAQLEAEDVYTDKAGIMNKILRAAISETSRKYVVADDIIIRSVELPELLQHAIAEKLIEEQTLQKYVYKLDVAKKEAERKEIEAGGIKTYQAIISETISEPLIKWQAVQATQGLIESDNAKVVIIGAGEQGLPVILGNQWGSAAPPAPPPQVEQPALTDQANPQ